MTPLTIFLGGVAAIAQGVAAVLWYRASRIEAPDNIDTFVGVMKNIGRLNKHAAMAQCIAATCTAVIWLLR